MPIQPEALSALLRELAATPGPAADWEEPLQPGERVGRFEILREIGRGGFGVVYEARDGELGRSVAFKAVRAAREGHGEAQLLREAEAIAKLQHPNLVTLFDVGRCPKGPYLVLELLRGETLAARLGRGRLPADEAVRIAVEVARGLAHAHGEGVVHRDLKPSNVFLTERSPVKLLDFGMAHAFGRQRVSGGTPGYMAPEQWRGAPEDERTDVFALGVMLYQMVTGELPFGPGGATGETGKAAPPVVTGVPGLAAAVAALLEREPARRPRNGEEALAALLPLLPPTTGSSTGTHAAARPRRWRSAVAGLVATALAAGAVGWAVEEWRAAHRAGRGPPSVAVLPFAVLSASPEDELFAEGIHGELITQLGKMSGLRVIARSSVEPYRARPRDLPAVAAALGVRSLLEGTIQREASRVRIAVHLVDPASGEQLWAERYDRQLADVFAIQTEVALEIARTLGTRLTAAERSLVAREPTRDREAHDLYLRGIYYWERSVGVEADDRMARELFEKAVARDPSFALALAGLAAVEAEHDDCALALGHAVRALALEPDLPRAHAARGHVRYFCDHDVNGAQRDYAQAVRGAPGDATARNLLGGMRTLAGQLEEGLADLREAMVLDPRSYLVAVDLAAELVRARRFDEAARAADRARELAPGDAHALALAAMIPAWQSGNLDPGRRFLAALPRELPDSGDGAWSFLQVCALFPEEALALHAAGRLREPFSRLPLLPLDYVTGGALASLGRAAEARADFAAAVPKLEARVKEAPEDGLARMFLARARAGAGQAEEAMKEVARAEALPGPVGRQASLLRLRAEVAAAAGRREEAVAALSAVLSRRDGLFTAAFLRVDPRFASLRGDPRFEALLRRAEAAGTPRP